MGRVESGGSGGVGVCVAGYMQVRGRVGNKGRSPLGPEAMAALMALLFPDTAASADAGGRGEQDAQGW